MDAPPQHLDETTTASERDVSEFAPLKINPDDYREIWADYEMTDTQFHELLSVVQDIALSFVNLGWNADISQIVFACAARNVRPDSDKLLQDTYSKATDNCIDLNAEEEKHDE